MILLTGTAEYPFQLYNTNGSCYIIIGQDSTSNEGRGVIGYIHDANTADNRYIGIWCRASCVFKAFKTKVEITAPLTVNGDVNINYSQTNNGTTFSVQTTSNICGQFLTSHTSSGSLFLGQTKTTAGCAQFYYDCVNKAVGLGMYGVSGIVINYNNNNPSISLTQSTTVSGATTINGDLTINGDKLTWYKPYLLNNSGEANFKIGANDNNYGLLTYTHQITNGTVSDVILGLITEKNSVRQAMIALYNQTILFCIGNNNNTIGTINSSGLDVSGNITCSSLTQKSDSRFKENIEELTDEQNIIDKIKVYSFNFKNDKDEPKRKHYGVIAQELQQIAPELVYDDKSENHYLSVNYTELIPHLIVKIQNQNKTINQLQSRIDKLYELLDIKE